MVTFHYIIVSYYLCPFCLIHVSYLNNYIASQPEYSTFSSYLDDGIVKVMIHIEKEEVVELHVDYFFQRQGIGSEMIKFAVQEKQADLYGQSRRIQMRFAFIRRRVSSSHSHAVCKKSYETGFMIYCLSHTISDSRCFFSLPFLSSV